VLCEVVGRAETLKTTIKSMQDRQLNHEEIESLVRKTIQLKLGEDFNVNLVDLNSFRARREEDQATDLYTVLNRVQEVLIRGGIQYKREIARPDDSNLIVFRNNTTRKVTSMKTEVELNQAIFDQALTILAA